MAALVAPKWVKNRRKRVFHSVFQTEISQPTPHSTPSLGFPEPGQAFGGPAPLALQQQLGNGQSFHATSTGGHAFGAQLAFGIEAVENEGIGLGLRRQDGASSPEGSQLFADVARQPSAAAAAAGDQIRFDRAWHVVTSAIALPSSATADDSFGTLPPESQYAQLARQSGSSEGELMAALEVVLHPGRMVPRAMHTENVLAWHTQQVRRHFAAHVLPLLAACAEGAGVEDDDVEGSETDGERMEMDEDAHPYSDGSHGARTHQQRRRRRRRRGGNYYEKNMVIVMSSVRTLEGALRLYFHGTTLIARGLKQGVGRSDIPAAQARRQAFHRFQRDVFALVGNSASTTLMSALRLVLVRLAGVILGFPAPDDPNKHSSRPCVPTQDNLRAEAARRRLAELMESLCNVGLAGEKFEVLFAEVMDGLMTAFIRGAYAGVWTSPKGKQDQYRDGSYEAPVSTLPQIAALSSPSWCTLSVCDWTENHFACLAHDVLSLTRRDSEDGEEDDDQQQKKQAITLSDVTKWQEMALGRLATLRISELFDIVLAWPASRAGLDDLRAAVTTPQRRLQLTDSFSATLQRRLLHPGRSTLEILQTYIAMIRTFHTLDHSKVLLGRVAPQLQLYLCQREDAVRIVVTGLLANDEEIQQLTQLPSKSNTCSNSNNSNKLVELAVLLNDRSQERKDHQPLPPQDPELDWADLDWVPDPIDAGTNYRRPRSEDVIGTLIGALGSQEVFIKEFQAIMAERLLSAQSGFAQEMRVLQLLKRRFGDAALQNCEVMVRDVRDSVKLDTAIRRVEKQQRQQQHQQPLSLSSPDYHARILSRLFWPNLARDRFTVPAPVATQQRGYEQGYEHLKSTRKLTWLDHLGQATVELDLQDRVVSVECATYEAVVIYAFQQDAQETAAARRTIEELEEQLHMDEELLQAALDFWVGKGVLRRDGCDAYVVVETLADAAHATSQDDYTTGATERPATTTGSPSKITSAAPSNSDPRRGVYWQFVVGMLTNSSAQMPLAQIAMMLKMGIADGFPWSNEELQEFLAEKVGTGELEVAGGRYRLARK